jgi:hypothetical protein
MDLPTTIPAEEIDLPYHHHSISRQTTVLTVDSVTAEVTQQ